MNATVKTFIASGAVSHRRLVKFTANDGEIAQASAATDKIAGVVDYPGGALDGQRVDVVLFGIADVDFGGTVPPGSDVTSDANGKAVAAAPAAGVNNAIAGRALTSAVSGDIAKTFINPGKVQG